MKPSTAPDLVPLIQAAAVREAWLYAHRAHWERRARTFEWAATPRPGDHLGTQTTPEQREERRRKLLSAAEACRLRATGVDGIATVHLGETLDDLRRNGGFAA